MATLAGAMRRSAAQGDVEAEAELGFQLAILYQMLANNPAAARQLERCQAQFSQLGDRHGQARSLNRLAYVAWRQHDLSQAERWVQAASALTEDEDAERAYSYFVLGVIALRRRAWQQAVDWLAASLRLRRAGDDKSTLAWGLSNLGLGLWQLGRHEEAKARLNEAIANFQAAGDPIHLAVATMNLGNVYFSLGEFQEAGHCFEEAEPVFRKTHDVTSLARVRNNMGKAYHALGKWARAIDAYRVSSTGWRSVGDGLELANTLYNLGLVFLTQNDAGRDAEIFGQVIEQVGQLEQTPQAEYLLRLANEHLAESRTNLEV